MANMTVNPFEGLAITQGGGWSAGHQGEDFATRRIWDYTAPSTSKIIAIGGQYHQIIGQRPDGSKWRMAEVAEILVTVGQEVQLGQIIGRNAFYRAGVYRSPHMNGGGDTGRSVFTQSVTHSKAAAAAIIAAGQIDKTRVRTVKAGVNAVRRMGPGTKFNKTGELLKAGTPGNFVAFAYGPISQGQPVGNNVWYQGISGDWFWSGSFDRVDGTGLVNKTAEFAHFDSIPLPPVIVVPVEPQEPEEGPIEDTPTPPIVVVPDVPVVVVPPVVVPDPEPEPPVVVEPIPEDPATPPVVEPPVISEPEPTDPPVTAPTPQKPTSGPAVGGIVGFIILLVGLVVAAVSGIFQ